MTANQSAVIKINLKDGVNCWICILTPLHIWMMAVARGGGPSACGTAGGVCEGAAEKIEDER